MAPAHPIRLGGGGGAGLEAAAPPPLAGAARPTEVKEEEEEADGLAEQSVMELKRREVGRGWAWLAGGRSAAICRRRRGWPLGARRPRTERSPAPAALAAARLMQPAHPPSCCFRRQEWERHIDPDGDDALAPRGSWLQMPSSPA